ncbi:MAG: sigma factor-like helix-turn-helix DNA-binding protein, partial [Chloroflexota bacterium]
PLRITILRDFEARKFIPAQVRAEPDNEDALTYGLRLLSTQQRKCIVERYFAQIPASVIAVRHNLPVERVNSLIAEGLEQLRAA